MKSRLLRLLARAGLLGVAFRGYELLSARRHGRVATADGLPVPPPELIVRVAWTGEVSWFLESGRLAAEAIRESLARHGRRLEEQGRLLDFGCGCGRVTRHWRDLRADLHGCDRDPRAIAWCRENLPFARFATNELRSSLVYADSSFDLVYALSVFTHLTEELQRAWLDELYRVLRPGGLLLLTTHGDAYRERLSVGERSRYDRAEVVVRWSEVEGTNLCAAYHSPAAVRDRLAAGWEFLELVPEGAAGNPHQDLTLLRRP